MKYIIANLKSNKNHQEMKVWLNELIIQNIKISQDVKVIICPPAPFVMMVAEFLNHELLSENFLLGVQDISPFTAGAYTGAISARNLEGLGVKYALVGHSERRRYFHESHQDVANKVAQCLENKITPIVCVDEDYIQAQANTINRDHLNKCIVAYEPLAAIGSGESQPIDEVLLIVQQARQIFENEAVIYGGSVTSANVASYLTVADGVLVGTDSLNAKVFLELISRVN